MKHLKDVYIGSEGSRIRMRAYDSLPKRYRELAYYINDCAVFLYHIHGADNVDAAWADARKRYPERFEVRT